MDKFGQTLDEQTFNDLLVSEIPKLRKRARFLTRRTPDPIEFAHELLGDTIVLALQSRHLYCEGSFSGWLSTIMHRKHFDNLRLIKRRGRAAFPLSLNANISESEEGSDLFVELAIPPRQEKSARLKQIFRLAEKWPAASRDTLQNLAFSSMDSHGTTRSRVCRMRMLLEQTDV